MASAAVSRARSRILRARISARVAGGRAAQISSGSVSGVGTKTVPPSTRPASGSPCLKELVSKSGTKSTSVSSLWSRIGSSAMVRK